MSLDYRKDSKERIPYEHYLEQYRQMDPKAAGGRTGIPFDEERGIFTMRLMGVTYEISWPDYGIRALPETEVRDYPLETAANAKILVLRYLLDGAAASRTGKFLTFREFPWGEVYIRQFQGRCVMRLAYGYGGKLDEFQKIMERLGGTRLKYGDCSYEFEFLNDLYLRFIVWAGDDEFPPNAQILFSDNFAAAFHGEDMAVVGDVSIGVLKAMSKNQ